ncbi:MAG: SDR family NAD(P)-dependent oxidoreductase, partial [Bdellovibrionales bacterium]|nr:SDR family NAD(P)-dependent oxidoreductase [Bdellovibrionales bacterium]
NFVKKAQQECGSIDLLVNNAGLALGVDHLADADPQDWTTMMDVNFIGAMKMTRAILPFMKDHSGARIIHIASIAGREAYEGGGGYCASKAAMKSMSRSLRLELLDRGIGVSCIDPGLVETEFSRVRFRGDEEKAKAVYAGVEALTAKDVAKTIAFVAMQEAHVNIDDVLITPMAQGFTKRTIRKTQS